ncbi:Hypothetical predicted protein [Octopus vulgaris]|uniref:Uncharacterized protein n=1 Tax=Octopus vulgaris TaxID=6645 RepID=A0AA36FB97_OCTVU|nr:Hypothetical predicted protein [Octopus vulgaris]
MSESKNQDGDTGFLNLKNKSLFHFIESPKPPQPSPVGNGKLISVGSVHSYIWVLPCNDGGDGYDCGEWVDNDDEEKPITDATDVLVTVVADITDFCYCYQYYCSLNEG